MNNGMAAVIAAVGVALKGVSEVVSALKARDRSREAELLELLEARQSEVLQLQKQLEDCLPAEPEVTSS